MNPTPLAKSGGKTPRLVITYPIDIQIIIFSVGANAVESVPSYRAYRVGHTLVNDDSSRRKHVTERLESDDQEELLYVKCPQSPPIESVSTEEGNGAVAARLLYAVYTDEKVEIER